jgi:hypothetical protein
MVKAVYRAPKCSTTAAAREAPQGHLLPALHTRADGNVGDARSPIKSTNEAELHGSVLVANAAG